MKKKEPKRTGLRTGISEITGKMVRVRHATEADMGFIENKLKKRHLDTENLHYSQFVVATENGNLIGFGRLKKTGRVYEIGCIIVVEERKRHGIGSVIVKHLIDYAPVKMVYVITDLVDYFKELGFEEIKKSPKNLLDTLAAACKDKQGYNKVLMVYVKPER